MNHIALFKSQGFVKLPSVIDHEEIDAVLCDVKKLIDNQLNHLVEPAAQGSSYDDLCSNMATLLTADQQRYLSSVRLAARLNSVRRLFLKEKVNDFLTDFGYDAVVMQSDPVFHIMGQSLKIPGGYFGFDPHQDWTSLQSSLDMVTIWIPLVDVNASNYPLEIIPGSHQNGLAPGTEEEHVYQIKAGLFSDSDFQSIEINSGDVVLMSSFAIHRSGVNGHEKAVRLAVSHRYENGSESSFIERGYPFSQTKSIERKLFKPNFPTQKDLAPIYQED